MIDPDAISLGTQILEVERELAMRERVYARHVEQHKMTKLEAERKIAIMTAVHRTLKRVAEKEAPHLL